MRASAERAGGGGRVRACDAQHNGACVRVACVCAIWLSGNIAAIFRIWVGAGRLVLFASSGYGASHPASSACQLLGLRRDGLTAWAAYGPPAALLGLLLLPPRTAVARGPAACRPLIAPRGGRPRARKLLLPTPFTDVTATQGRAGPARGQKHATRP